MMKARVKDFFGHHFWVPFLVLCMIGGMVGLSFAWSAYLEGCGK